MRAGTLANLLKTTKETIRYYRNKGYLHPSLDPSNGYFAYSMNDYHALRALLGKSKENRGDVIYAANNASVTGLIQKYQTLVDSIDEEIRKLEEKKKEFQYELDYYHAINEESGQVILSKDAPALYYTDYKSARSDEKLSFLLSHPATYDGIVIPLEEFLDPKATLYHPGHVIGVMESDFTKDALLGRIEPCKFTHIPSRCAVLRLITTLKQTDPIPALLFDPVKEYANKHNLQFVRDVTSIILEVHSLKDEYEFLFLFRFAIEQCK